MAQSESDTPVVVIGAGIVGVSTAIWLQRFGHRVVLVDKAAPGSGASYGNAGLIAQWAVAPVTSPDLWRHLPRYLVDPNAPLFLRWRHLPRLAPWLRQLLSHATDKGTREIVDNTIPMVTDAVEQHKALVAGTGVDGWLRDSKFSYVYRDKAAFEADAYSWEMKARAGFRPVVITGPAVQEEEPILGPSMSCLAVLEGQGHVTDPGAYITALAEHFVDSGGKLIRAAVQDLTFTDGRITTVLTDDGPLPCAHAILTAGIWSKDLMAKLGLEIPMEAERGYHVIFENPSELPRHPMMITSGKFGVNPMDMGLRCAGTVELADHHTGPSKAPLRLLHRYAKAAFPNLTYSGTQEWLGFRPTLPDSTPMIGQIGATGVFTGFGHQHVGLTAGPKTGRLLAQMITGDVPNMDMRAYAPDRFS